MKAVYVAGRLVAPGGCPICNGVLTATLLCTRPSCGKQWPSLTAVHEAYELVGVLQKALEEPPAVRK